MQARSPLPFISSRLWSEVESCISGTCEPRTWFRAVHGDRQLSMDRMTTTHLLLGSSHLQQPVCILFHVVVIEHSHGKLHRYHKVILVLTNVYKFFLNGPDMSAKYNKPQK